METLARQIGLRRCELPFADVVDASLQESWTRDPFDRIVVAQSRLRGAALLTKDRNIHDHFDEAVWPSGAPTS